MIVVCNNAQCEGHNQQLEVADWDGVSSMKLMELLTCPNCGERRQILDPLEEPKEIEFQYAKVSSMSPQDRKKLLKQRSNEHFQRALKEKKDYTDASLFGKTK